MSYLCFSPRLVQVDRIISGDTETLTLELSFPWGTPRDCHKFVKKFAKRSWRESIQRLREQVGPPGLIPGLGYLESILMIIIFVLVGIIILMIAFLWYKNCSISNTVESMLKEAVDKTPTAVKSIRSALSEQK